VILITHRMSTLSVVDNVLVLQEGAVKAYGPRDKVLGPLMQARAAQQRQGGAPAGAPGMMPQAMGPGLAPGAGAGAGPGAGAGAAPESSAKRSAWSGAEGWPGGIAGTGRQAPRRHAAHVQPDMTRRAAHRIEW
jgi:energy-coupling factor transporter ATP-binding protein EcfA2